MSTQLRYLINNIKMKNMPAYHDAILTVDDYNIRDDQIVDGTSNGWTLLHYAVASGNIDVVQDLLRRGAKINLKSKGTMGSDNLTPSMLAVIDKNYRVLEALLERSEIVEAGLLSHAVAIGWRDGVRMLLKKGADPNVKDRKYKNSPLHRAAFGQMPDLVQSLIDAGANVFSKDGDGDTPAEMAVYGESEVSLKIIISSGYPIETIGNNGCTLFLSAIRTGHPKMAIYLLSLGAKSNVSDHSGKSAKEWCKEAIKELMGSGTNKCEMMKSVLRAINTCGAM